MSNIDEKAKNILISMMRIEPLLEGGNRLWCIEIQKYYVFFYEINNGRRIMGKNKDIGYSFVV